LLLYSALFILFHVFHLFLCHCFISYCVSVFLLSHLFLKQPFLSHDTDISIRSLVPALSFRIMSLLPHVLLFCLKNCVKLREMLVAMYTASQAWILTCLCDWYLHLLLGVQQLLAQRFRMWLCLVILSSTVEMQPISLEIFSSTDSVRILVYVI
jgi:hypothetical protein